MNTKQILASAVLFAVSMTSASAAYPEIECSTDAVFSVNSCDQCFDWSQKAVGDTIGFIKDDWTNTGNVARIFYKEEQTNPEMLSLGGSVWGQTPDSDNFWVTPEEFEALYSENDQWYILEPGQTTTFIEWSIESAYVLESTDLAQWENAGLLVFPLLSHSLSADGEISDNDTVHKECVLFKAWANQVAPTPSPDPGTPTEPAPENLTQVETGAEAYLILLFALILGFVYIKTRKQA